MSLLHSRTAPAAFAVKPEPVTVTLVPPFRQVPGLAVRLGLPVDVADLASHGTIVVVVVGCVVVVVELVVDVVLAVVVVVVVVVVPEKLMLEVA